MGHLRTDEQWVKYERYKAEGGLEGGCRLCEAPALKTFSHWKIMENKFPFDKIAKLHHMILPKRHVAEPDLSQEEAEEFKKIKEEYLHTTYEFIIEATHLKKSIPDHFHLHLVLAKD